MIRRKNALNNDNRNHGITLIALVITIVILLILAGVLINQLTSDNGLIGRAKESRNKANYNTAYEELNLKIATINVDKQGKATFEDIILALNEDEVNLYTIYFESKIAKISNLGDIIESDINDNSLSEKLENKEYMYIIYKEYEFKINKELSINNDYSSNVKEIKEENKELSIDATEENMIAGNTFTINYTVSPSGTEVEWTSDDEDVATVSNGVVTAIDEGTANITAKIKGTRLSKTCVINVTSATARIGTQYYATLSDAIASVPTTNEQKTINLLRTTHESISIASGKNIVFEGGNYILYGSSGDTTVTNSGTLTINSGKIYNDAYPIQNTGTLTIVGGYIRSTSFNALINWGTANIAGGKVYNYNGTDFPIWQKAGTLNVYGGTIQTGNKETIYANGGTTNLSGSNRMVTTISTMPVKLAGGTVSGPAMKNLTSTSCTIYMYTNNSNVKSVRFPTWTLYNSQDDIIWGTGTSAGNNVFYYTVNTSSHNNEKENYATHIYCYNSSGGTVFANNELAVYSFQ